MKRIIDMCRHKKTLNACALLLLLFCACSEQPRQTMPVENVASLPTREAKDCRVLKQNARIMDSTLVVAVEMVDSVAMRAIDAFTTFALYCDHDTTTPVFLIKTAQVARAIGKHSQAKASLETCISNFRDFSDRPAAIFLLAQLYEDPTYMQNRDEAERLYHQVIDEYPGSVWAGNARAALTIVGKSEEEIIKMLKKRS